MRYYIFMMLLLAVVLFQGCSERDQRTETNTTQTIDPALQTLALQIETAELPENNDTTVTLKTYDGQDITSNKNIVWHISDTNVTEINGTKLFAKAEGTATIRAEVDGEYSQEENVTVYKLIHGHRLPPEPDPKLNNATLLGVDSNNNGVRDDVERYIVFRFSKEAYPKTRIALAMQYAWAMQKVIENPTKESAKYINDAIDCQYYWFNQKQLEQRKQLWDMDDNDPDSYILSSEMAKWRLQYGVFDDDAINSIILNTTERTKRDFMYNGAMSGGMYKVREKSIDNCQTNIDLLDE